MKRKSPTARIAAIIPMRITIAHVESVSAVGLGFNNHKTPFNTPKITAVIINPITLILRLIKYSRNPLDLNYFYHYKIFKNLDGFSMIEESEN